MNHIDYQYILLLSSQLDGLRQVGKNWNVRCPICGDSEKSKKKKRGWLLTDGEHPVFYCHNCGASMSFQNLLKELNPLLYKEYLYDLLKEKGNISNDKFRSEEPNANDIYNEEVHIENKAPAIRFDDVCTKISLVDPSHEAYQYLKSREVPEKVFDRIYWVDSVKNLKVFDREDKYTIRENNGRIVFPQFSPDGLVGVSCRSIKQDNSLRYLNYKFMNAPMIFGLFNEQGEIAIDRNRQIFITEGAVDSLFLDNAIAVNGADLTRVLQLLSNMNVVFIPDNEPRNSQILEFYTKIINLGVQIVIFPNHIVGKDINLMILNHGRDYILETIKNNIYQGIKAKLKFISWKRR